MSQDQGFVIHWFRQDLRLADNPALFAAAKQGQVLPIYILDDENPGKQKIGAASRWWLHHSLTALDKSLDHKLCIFRGDAQVILQKLTETYPIQGIFWNRCYEPWRIKRDEAIKKIFKQKNISVESFNGSLLWEPWEVLKTDGTYYKVFTPFYRRGCLQAMPPRQPLAKPQTLKLHEKIANSLTIADLNLLPQIRWDKHMEKIWDIGEMAAKKRLNEFIAKGLENYKIGRDFPAKAFVSRLSPHLHIGEISPNQVWYAAKNAGDDKNIDHFHSELGWREFSYSLLYHNPQLAEKNLQEKFNLFPWKNNRKKLIAWQKGLTGYPIVDAGMRQLWQTGYMHNRVRMIVGSFLVKNLLLHWHHGEAWFWDCLVDADLASNSASWQWVAGCGADAAPYFRIFNPITQGKKFDANGEYTRQYVPELKALPDEYLFNPWEAPQALLSQAGIKLGETYPLPIVDLPASRQAALAAYEEIKGK
ncbi:MAG: deoxyribodipyrimidine photo-lyase [Pseudomonadota bacterium]